MYDLPSEDPEEPGLPDEYHCYQSPLLRHTFRPVNVDLDRVFVGIDLNLYYDWQHSNWYKRPDWFAVLGVSRLYEGENLRLSYVMWQEQVSPFVIVELLSSSTADEDLGRTVSQAGRPPTKWYVYEQILRVPYYVVFSGTTNEILGFRLVAGVYEQAELIGGCLPIPQLGLSLGLWQGIYEKIDRTWLRWFTLEGELILTPQEESEQQAAQSEQQTAQSEQRAAESEQRAAQSEQRAQRLAAKLRELNIDPDELH
ncbi:Uma2 family endonuclease [Microcoleus sp. LEGE 07076]|nr:Uma2 family endonuclease [Microcoleus sp. LEGE 07076]